MDTNNSSTSGAGESVGLADALRQEANAFPAFHQRELRRERSVTACAATTDAACWVNGAATDVPVTVSLEALLTAFRHVAEPKAVKSGASCSGCESSTVRRAA